MATPPFKDCANIAPVMAKPIAHIHIALMNWTLACYLGTSRFPMRQLKYPTRRGIEVTRSTSKIPYQRGLRKLLTALDTRRGIYLSSGYEFPGRYSRWDFGSICPPLEVVAYGRHIEFRPL